MLYICSNSSFSQSPAKIPSSQEVVVLLKIDMDVTLLNMEGASILGGMLTFFQSLRQLHLVARLSIFLFSLLIAVLVLIATTRLSDGHSMIPILMLPIAVAAWLFSAHVTALCLIATYLADAVLVTLVTHTLLWPPFVILVFTFSALAMTAEAFGVSMLRYAVDHAQVVKQKELRAEQELASAFKRQRIIGELKDQFFLNMSHELHTPLTELRGYIELLREHHERIDTATQMQFLDHASHGCNELEQIVDMVLQAACLDQAIQATQCEEVNVVSAVRAVLDNNILQALPHHVVQVSIAEELVVWVDRKQFQQILHNVLSNALKYSPPCAPITISATLLADQPASSVPAVCIRIQDAGPGIPKDDLPLLFNRAVRLPRDVTGTVRGSGLGLYISKQLVEGLGGQIWVESPGIPGQGSCFCITLPSVIQDTRHASISVR